MRIAFDSLSVLLASALLLAGGGCSHFSQKVVLEGAVARVTGSEVLIAPISELQAEEGQTVTIYQRVDQAAVDPTNNDWHLLKPVATGILGESGPDGIRVMVRSGKVEPRGEIQLRQER